MSSLQEKFPPWLLDFVMFDSKGPPRAQMLYILKALPNPFAGVVGSCAKLGFDGDLAITVLFTAKALCSICPDQQSQSTCTSTYASMPNWDRSRILLKDYSLDYQITDKREETQFILKVNKFTLWNLEMGYTPKILPMCIMQVQMVKFKAGCLWLKERERDSERVAEDLSQSDVPLTQLLELAEITGGDSCLTAGDSCPTAGDSCPTAGHVADSSVLISTSADSALEQCMKQTPATAVTGGGMVNMTDGSTDVTDQQPGPSHSVTTPVARGAVQKFHTPHSEGRRIEKPDEFFTPPQSPEFPAVGLLKLHVHNRQQIPNKLTNENMMRPEHFCIPSGQQILLDQIKVWKPSTDISSQVSSSGRVAASDLILVSAPMASLHSPTPEPRRPPQVNKSTKSRIIEACDSVLEDSKINRHANKTDAVMADRRKSARKLSQSPRSPRISGGSGFSSDTVRDESLVRFASDMSKTIIRDVSPTAGSSSKDLRSVIPDSSSAVVSTAEMEKSGISKKQTQSKTISNPGNSKKISTTKHCEGVGQVDSEHKFPWLGVATLEASYPVDMDTESESLRLSMDEDEPTQVNKQDLIHSESSSSVVCLDDHFSINDDKTANIDRNASTSKKKIVSESFSERSSPAIKMKKLSLTLTRVDASERFCGDTQEDSEREHRFVLRPPQLPTSSQQLSQVIEISSEDSGVIRSSGETTDSKGADDGGGTSAKHKSGQNKSKTCSAQVGASMLLGSLGMDQSSRESSGRKRRSSRSRKNASLDSSDALFSSPENREHVYEPWTCQDQESSIELDDMDRDLLRLATGTGTSSPTSRPAATSSDLPQTQGKISTSLRKSTPTAKLTPRSQSAKKKRLSLENEHEEERLAAMMMRTSKDTQEMLRPTPLGKKTVSEPLIVHSTQMSGDGQGTDSSLLLPDLCLSPVQDDSHTDRGADIPTQESLQNAQKFPSSGESSIPENIPTGKSPDNDLGVNSDAEVSIPDSPRDIFNITDEKTDKTVIRKSPRKKLSCDDNDKEEVRLANLVQCNTVDRADLEETERLKNLAQSDKQNALGNESEDVIEIESSEESHNVTTGFSVREPSPPLSVLNNAEEERVQSDKQAEEEESQSLLSGRTTRSNFNKNSKKNEKTSVKETGSKGKAGSKKTAKTKPNQSLDTSKCFPKLPSSAKKPKYDSKVLYSGGKDYPSSTDNMSNAKASRGKRKLFKMDSILEKVSPVVVKQKKVRPASVPMEVSEDELSDNVRRQTRRTKSSSVVGRSMGSRGLGMSGTPPEPSSPILAIPEEDSDVIGDTPQAGAEVQDTHNKTALSSNQDTIAPSHNEIKTKLSLTQAKATGSRAPSKAKQFLTPDKSKLSLSLDKSKVLSTQDKLSLMPVVQLQRLPPDSQTVQSQISPVTADVAIVQDNTGIEEPELNLTSPERSTHQPSKPFSKRVIPLSGAQRVKSPQNSFLPVVKLSRLSNKCVKGHSKKRGSLIYSGKTQTPPGLRVTPIRRSRRSKSPISTGLSVRSTNIPLEPQPQPKLCNSGNDSSTLAPSSSASKQVVMSIETPQNSLAPNQMARSTLVYSGESGVTGRALDRTSDRSSLISPENYDGLLRDRFMVHRDMQTLLKSHGLVLNADSVLHRAQFPSKVTEAANDYFKQSKFC